ncbi:hypothetical protein CALCODRAFT_154433 [Calocera cornea HHB12733]|uniref:Secreted protein n=1 Tax=Calocera cornea HHB12733 TaxID=1353952 RepID=A0A165CLG2_9BASI|nr:hypothetical protein CALCODRAFT_154433 [Calocera cornea HHB12733]
MHGVKYFGVLAPILMFLGSSPAGIKRPPCQTKLRSFRPRGGNEAPPPACRGTPAFRPRAGLFQLLHPTHHPRARFRRSFFRPLPRARGGGQLSTALQGWLTSRATRSRQPQRYMR